MLIETIVSTALKYYGLVFIAAVGVIQAAAAYNRLMGISFFNRKIFSYLFACSTTVPSLAWFFVRGAEEPTGAIEGAQQFGLFAAALGTALAVTLVVSSLLRHSRLKGNNAKQEGLETLRETSYLEALRHRAGRR
jgi:hypothetical protein